MEMTMVDEAIEIDDPSAVGEVRRRVGFLATEAGLPVARAADAALIATEATSNVVKHAGHGGVLLSRIPGGLTITAWDRGPGMDVERCLRDGMSTAGTAGAGLGAIARLATSWDAHSAPGQGTVLTVTVTARGAPSRWPGHEVAAVTMPFPGEHVTGDGWAVDDAGDVATVVVCDGLGHGPVAAEASAAVIEAFRRRPGAEPAAILRAADGACRSTRGAAAAVVRIDASRRSATFASIGNVAGWIWADGRMRAMVSQHGTLGHAVPRIREEVLPVPPGGVVLLCTDGIRGRLDLSPYMGLARRTAPTIAGVAWRDFARERDDVTVVVVRP